MSEKDKKHDDFWDLSALLPKKRPPVMRQTRPDVSSVEINIGTENEEVRKDNDDLRSLSARFREIRQSRDFSELHVEKSNKDAEKIRIDVEKLTKDAQRIANEAVELAKEIVNSVSSEVKKALPQDRTSFDIPKNVSRQSRPTSELIAEYDVSSGLLRHVKIMRWPTNYTFYDQFRSDARRLYRVTGNAAPRVEYFSYTPQYRQMTKPQLDFYFYFRSCVRRGEFIPADFSYVLLYVYEIINLHDVLDPKAGLKILCDLWVNYRDTHKALDKYLSEWVADFCLINQLPTPTEALAPIMYAVLEATSFREFYMTGDTLDPETLISLSSNYIWQKSKYVSDVNSEAYKLYKKHLPRALGYVISHSPDDRFNVASMKPSRVSRDAFCGSLCAHNIKRRIDIEYLSYSRSTDLKILITDIVKYSENRLRAHLGIKSRLRVDSLDDKIKLLLDDYFKSEFPNDRRRSHPSDTAAAEERYYDSMYGALSRGIDESEAKKLEAESWRVTDRLTEEMTDADAVGDISDIISEDTETDITEAASPSDIFTFNTVETPTSADTAGGSYTAFHTEFIRLSRLGDSDGLEALCKAHSRYADEAASEINAVAVDKIGDIILEHDGTMYRTVEDYSDEIDEILNEI